jgi:inhibitor of KinA sporulation pathway (predicted exonuclease)
LAGSESVADLNYIVLDLEWNQCPYGKKKEDPKLPFEIIEIGAVKLDASFHEVSSFHETIRPVLYRKLHYMTRSVIHMTEEDFEGKRTFPHVFADFLIWCGDAPVFCTWGPGDLTELQRNVRWHIDHGNLTGRWPFPFPFFYRDVQKIFSYEHEDGKKRRSLAWAVDFLQIEKTEEFHDAFSDARYTARIFELMRPEDVKKHTSIDTYHTPSRRSEEILVHYDNYVKFISKSFPEREAVMKDRVVTSTRCLVCGQRIRRTIRWFSDNGRNYLCIASCPEHGLFRSKIRIRQNADDQWYVVKTTRAATQEDVDITRKKQETLRHRRKMHRTN